jgi:hypothetical protein
MRISRKKRGCIMGKWLEMLKAESEPHPGNPALPESGKADSKVVPMTPATPEPVSEAAIMKAMERACIGLPITPGEFRAAIDADEAGWCATGRIPIKTARAFARLFAGDLAKDPGHPINHHMVTCWGCAHYRGKFCLKRCAARDDKWLRCDGYQEATR